MSESFTHLHTHTEFSMLDGAARVEDLVNAADGGRPAGPRHHRPRQHVRRPRLLQGLPTRRGSSPSSASRRTWRPRAAYERPVRRGKMDDTGGDAEGGQKLYYHLTLSRQTTTRATRTCSSSPRRPTSRATTTSPGSTGSCSSAYHEGLIATTGCLGGRGATRRCWRGRRRGCDGHAARLQEIFGKDNLFVELQDHGLAEQRTTNPQADRNRPKHRGAAAGHQRQPLHAPRRRRGPRRPAVRADRRAAGRPQPLPLRRRRSTT